MAYTKQYEQFVGDKYGFFSDITKTPVNEAIDKTHTAVKAHDFKFLSDNKMLIEQEFNSLFSSLQKKGEKRQEFWLYCYYCCEMLHAYYVAYDNPAKASDYDELKTKIKVAFETGKFPEKHIKQKSFLQMLGNTIAGDLSKLADTPRHISQMRDKVGLLNAWRIYWVFLRLVMTNSLVIAQEAQLIDQLGKLLGRHIDVANIIKTLEAPNSIFRVFSVGFFVLRFIMNAGMLVKHTFFPSDKEPNVLTTYERFTNELVKRHPEFLNDVVWATVNLLTNYNELFHISAPVAGWTIAAFLFFDVCLLLWRRHLAEVDYSTKKSQLTADREHFQIEFQHTNSSLLEEQGKVINEQLVELEISWNAKSATFLFNASAAFLLVSGFSAAMLFTPGLLVIGSYAVCMTGVAMYLSDGAYNKYKESLLVLDQTEIENKDTTSALASYQTARNTFIETIIKNLVLPGLFITTYALCWEAALVLTATYIAYELISSYVRHSQDQESAVAEEVPVESNFCFG